MVTTPEGKVKQKISALLKALRVWYFMPQGGAFGRSGVPDYIACYKGQMIGIEAKASRTSKPTALQEQAMAQIEANGGKCFVVCDEESLEQVREYINARS